LIPLDDMSGELDRSMTTTLRWMNVMMTRTRFPLYLVGAVGLVVSLSAGTTAAARQAQSSREPAVIPENASALEGLPAVRIDASKEGATRRTLNGAEASKQSLKIQIVNGQYYWASRDNRPLTLSSSGEFVYLTSAEPGQYVRFKRINDRIAYVEHVDMAFGSVTYWGELRIVLDR
jgi:hypothetical protein